jgi:hypothetical protein
MFDKDFSFSKTKTPQDQTDISNIESHTTLPPSFNLSTIKKSTPMRPIPAPRMANRQTSTPETEQIEIELHQTASNDTSVDYVTARQLSV